MKKFLVLFIALVFVVGCGKREKKTQFQGVTETEDFIAQGMQYLSESDIPNAIRSFDEAIKRDPMNPDNYLILGQVYLRLKQHSRAVDSFTAALRVDPFNGEAYYLLATSQAFRGNFELAIEAAQKSIEIFVKYRDEEKFKRSVALLRSLLEAEQAKQSVSEEESDQEAAGDDGNKIMDDEEILKQLQESISK